MRYTVRAVLLAMLAFLVGCSDPGPGGDDGDVSGDGDVATDGDADGDADGDMEGEDGDVPDDVPFAVTGVIPDHGIFSGLTEVVVRGRGFVPGEPVEVFFGDRPVPIGAVEIQDENRIACLTPPGEPDSFADVRVVQGELEATLADGFYYDPCTLSPSQGSTSGGTYVVIRCLGTDFAGEVSVTFDGAEAEDVTVNSATEITLRTPPGRVGPADVSITNVTGDVELAEAYSYFDNTDPTSGGLGGDAVSGNVQVTVIDGGSGGPLPDSFVILGVDTGTEYQGRTDGSGNIVFSGPDLAGRQVIITVSHGPVDTPMDYDCDGEAETPMQTFYESASFTEFDATYVTVILRPIPPPPPMCPGPMPGGTSSYIEGELMFESMGEFGPYDWEIVPSPIPPNERKITFVATTAPDIFYDPLRGEMPTTGTIAAGPDSVVTEEDIGENGFTYRIASRFGAVAVYALSGIYNDETHEFTPYAFGIHRGVLVPPGETVSGIDILMVTPLDETVFVELDGAPTQSGWDSGPNRYIVETYVDLGVEGVIWRPDRSSTRNNASALHSFPSWMPRMGELADSTLTVAAHAYSFADVDGDGEEDLVYPFSVRYLRGITNWEATAVVGDWIGIPHPDDPSYGGMVRDNRMSWENGSGDIHFTNVRLTRARMPWWNMILPGNQVEVEVPPLPRESVPDGTSTQFDVWHHRVLPGFIFDRWSYNDLGRDVQVGYAANAWLVEFPTP